MKKSNEIQSIEPKVKQKKGRKIKKLRNEYVYLYLETDGPFKGMWSTVLCRPVQGRRKIGTFDDPFSRWPKKEATKLAKQLLGKRGFPNPRAVKFHSPRWTVGWGDVDLLSRLDEMSHVELGRAFGIPEKRIREHAARLASH
jgi:hypothetical protein